MNPAPNNSYQVVRLGAAVYVRSVGLANMKNASVIDAFLHEVISDNVSTVCIDLSVCTGMDSTFMGVLVGYSQLMSKKNGRLVVVNPTESNLRLLNMLGVSAVLPVLERCDLGVLELVALPNATAVSPAQRIEMIKRAHQSLATISDANRAKFSAFLSALDADLAKQKNRKESDNSSV